jgi:hypothetical protein
MAPKSRSAPVAAAIGRLGSGSEPFAQARRPAVVIGMSEFSEGGASTSATGAIGLDQILPCQFFDRRGADRMGGEQRLMLAILADAINVYQCGVLSRCTRKRMLYLDAERWITAAPRPLHPFSFETVCEALEIEPGALRRRLIAWKHRMRRDRESAHPAPHLRLKITPRASRMRPGRKRQPRSI